MQRQRRFDFPDKKRAVLQVDRQLERNAKLSTTTLRKLRNSLYTIEEALLRCSVSKENPRFPWDSKGSSTCFTKLQKFPKIPVPSREEHCFPPQVKKSPVFPASSRDEGRLPCHTCKGMPTSPSHLKRRLVSIWNWMRTLVPCHNSKATSFPIHLRSGLISLHRFECQPRIISQHKGSSDAPVANPKRAPCPKFNSAGGMKPL